MTFMLKPISALLLVAVAAGCCPMAFRCPSPSPMVRQCPRFPDDALKDPPVPNSIKTKSPTTKP